MSTTDVDLGARCDRHAGEAFTPRCADCDAANRDLEQQIARERHERAQQRNAALGITPGRQPTFRPIYRQRR